MRLKSFGCSFIFGSDLHDDGSGTNYAKHSHFTWPSLLAQHLGYGYDCYARPGIGNLRIAERVLSQAACNERHLFVIGWTWIDRFDYTTLDDRWQTIMPTTETDEGLRYYRDYHSQYRDKLSTLMNIRICIDTLRQKGCPFIMTFMDELVFEDKWHATPAITDMQDYIRPYLSDFNGKNFLDWSKEHGYKISDMLHPLEDAHRSAADLVALDLDNWIKT